MDSSHQRDGPSRLPLHLDSTMVSTFRSCPRKFEYQYIEHLRPTGVSIHLTAGGAYAAGLDAARKRQAQFPESPLPHEDVYRAAFTAFLKEWDGPLDVPDNPKNIHNMLHALELYLQQFHPFYDEVQPLRFSDGSISSEFSFAIPLDIKHPSGDPFVYVGRFDMLGRHVPSDRLVVLDDKTTGSLSSYWMSQWDMRGQFLGYCWACQKLGYNVTDVIVRGTGIMKTDIRFLPVPVQYSMHKLQRWEQELYYTLEQMIFYEQRNHFPYNFADACTSYGGCPMKQLCEAQHPEEWYGAYEKSIWNPIHGDH